VVLLTHKKPGNAEGHKASTSEDIQIRSVPHRSRATSLDPVGDTDTAPWGIGEDSDDEEIPRKSLDDKKSGPLSPTRRLSSNSRLSPIAKLRKLPSNLSLRSPKRGLSGQGEQGSEEARGLMQDDNDDEDDHPIEQPRFQRGAIVRGASSPADSDDFGSWEDGGKAGEER
jgi:hypothetical protein